MKHRAHAPELKFGSDPEPFALIAERAPDWDAHQRRAEQRRTDQATSQRHQLTLDGPACDCGNVGASWHGDPRGLREYMCDRCWNESRRLAA